MDKLLDYPLHDFMHPKTNNTLIFEIIFAGSAKVKSTQTRRDWLKYSIGGIALTSVGLVSHGRTAARETALQDLIVRTETPLNAEPPLEKLLENWITPDANFFVRCHGTLPSITEAQYSLKIEGLVDKPVTLTLAELKSRFASSSATATLICAGNRRGEFAKVKKVGGVQWGAGAISNAEWSGVRLSDVLKSAGIQASAKHIWFEGSDEVTEKGKTFAFGGSIPTEKAMADTATAPGCLLATTMNGKPLSIPHGFPLRTIVPGFIGARSVKWLSKIVVSDRPSPNHFLADVYKIVPEDTPAATATANPIYEFLLNSIICSPDADASVKGERLSVKGVALPGGQTGRSIKRVEVSPDGGQTWSAAKITSPVREYCWVHWSAEVPITPKTESLLVRAVDTSDEIQPRETPWNAKGYQNNGWHKVSIKQG